jgi:hypothetical protein
MRREEEGGRRVPTMRDHEAVLRAKCLNGTLYRRDAKLSNWLGVPEEEVKFVLDRLKDQGVLIPNGISERGSERYRLGLPSHLSPDARRLYKAMLSKSTAFDVVNVTTLGELANVASMGEERTRRAFSELSRAHLVTEDTFGDHRLPVILRRAET